MTRRLIQGGLTTTRVDLGSLSNSTAKLIGPGPMKTRHAARSRALLVGERWRAKQRRVATGAPKHCNTCPSRAGRARGKTTVGRADSEIQCTGWAMCARPHSWFHYATADDLVGQYIGHTARNAASIISGAWGPRLFIDEAVLPCYRPENERDYGGRRRDPACALMEEQPHDLCRSSLATKTGIGCLLSVHPGLSSRWPTTSTFRLQRNGAAGDCQTDHGGRELSLQREASAAFADYSRRNAAAFFANARSIRNAIISPLCARANTPVQATAAVA